MAVPKKRRSKSKSAMIKAGKKQVAYRSISKCPNCGGVRQAHRICTNCGYYNGRVHKLKAHASTAGEETAASEE